MASSCKDLPHDGTRGLFVTVDRSACPDVPVDSLMVGVYTQDGRLVKERRYSGGERYSPILYTVDGGCYTVVAVANWAEGDAPRPGMSRPALMQWLTRSAASASEGVSKSTPSFLYDKAPTFTSCGFVIT